MPRALDNIRFPDAIENHHVQTHLFDGYWEDIGTIRSFFDANLSLASDKPHFPLFTPNAPIYTRARYLPPCQIAGATVRNSLISNGCIVGEGCTIENSVIGLRTVLGRDVTIRNSIVMGADYYESENNTMPSIPLGIGDSTVIDGAIIDKDCRVGKNVIIINDSGIEDSRQDHEVCVIRDGIPVIIKESTVPDGKNLSQILE